MANKHQLLSLVFTTFKMHGWYDFEGEPCFATLTSSQTVPCHTAMASLSEHLLSTSSSLQAEVGIKKVKVKIPCSGQTFQEHCEKAFILNK